MSRIESSQADVLYPRLQSKESSTGRRLVRRSLSMTSVPGVAESVRTPVGYAKNAICVEQPKRQRIGNDQGKSSPTMSPASKLTSQLPKAVAQVSVV